MTLALELAHHGVKSVVLERNHSTTSHPKMDLTNGRSMELFRRYGIASEMRLAGVPSDQKFDIVWATSLAGSALYRFNYPSPDRKREIDRVVNDGTRTLEPGLRVSQVELEPVLKAAIDSCPLVDVRFGWAFEKFTSDENGVEVTAVSALDGKRVTISGDWLAACDGGGSLVRQQAEIELDGEFAVANVFMIHFRSSDPILHRLGTPAYHLQTGLGTLIAQNGRDIFTLHTPVPDGIDPESFDYDGALKAFVGQDFSYEVLVANAWTPHVVVAREYRRGRVVLVGDASHQFIPTGGFGMNTGIGDAVGCGWMLAAVVNGWAGEGLVDAFAIERRQVAIRNRQAAIDNLDARNKAHSLIAEAMMEGGFESPSALDRRDQVSRALAEIGNPENEMWGIEHGYRYDNSPAIVDEIGEAPALDRMRAIPTTWPGSRLPLIFLANGTPIYDLLGPEFTLLVIGDTETGDWPYAAAKAGMPLKIVHIPFEPKCTILERKLVLVRPDHHVAWRADIAPADATGIVAKVTGREHTI